MAQLVRTSLRVTWRAERGEAPWPDWQTPERGHGLVPAATASTDLWMAVAARGGLSFSCGTVRDEDDDEREAACHIVSARILAHPGPWSGNVSMAVARVDVESETVHGPNSHSLGREVAERLSGAEWEYASGRAARLDVAWVETYVANAGWVALFPERDSDM